MIWKDILIVANKKNGTKRSPQNTQLYQYQFELLRSPPIFCLLEDSYALLYLSKCIFCHLLKPHFVIVLQSFHLYSILLLLRTTTTMLTSFILGTPVFLFLRLEARHGPAESVIPVLSPSYPLSSNLLVFCQTFWAVSTSPVLRISV